jgi:hypothetical protein
VDPLVLILPVFPGHESPGDQLEPNWIPAPFGPFLAGLRMYGPSTKVQNDQWHMPALGKADWPWGARERL